MPVYVSHLTDVSARLGPFPSIDAALIAIRSAGGYPVSVGGVRIVYDDFPRAQPYPPHEPEFPGLPINLLHERMGK